MRFRSENDLSKNREGFTLRRCQVKAGDKILDAHSYFRGRRCFVDETSQLINKACDE